MVTADWWWGVLYIYIEKGPTYDKSIGSNQSGTACHTRGHIPLDGFEAFWAFAKKSSNCSSMTNWTFMWTKKEGDKLNFHHGIGFS